MRQMRAWLTLMLLSAPLGIALAADGIPTGARKTIDTVNAEWVPALEAGDVGRACQGFADDAIFISEDGNVTNGVAAFEAALRKRMNAGMRIHGGKVTSMGARMVNGQIIEWGDSNLVIVDKNGSSQQGGGYYLAVWSKDKHGVWSITRNIAIGAPP